MQKEIDFWNKDAIKRRKDISKLNKKNYLNNLIKKRFWWHKYIKKIKGKKVFEIGCGTEDDFIPFWIINNNSVVAIDISPETIKTNKMLLDKLGLKAELICADVKNFSSKSKFDVVHIKWVLHHLHSIPPALKNIRSVIKSNGILILSETNYLYPIRWFTQTTFLEPVNIFRKLAMKFGLDPNERGRTPHYYKRELRKNGFEIKNTDYKQNYMFFSWLVRSITKNKLANNIAIFLDKILLLLEFPKYFGMEVKIIAVAKQEN